MSRRTGVLLCLIAAVSSLPYAFCYFWNLTRHAHYDFFPVVLVAVGWLFYTRAKGSSEWRVASEDWRSSASQSDAPKQSLRSEAEERGEWPVASGEAVEDRPKLLTSSATRGWVWRGMFVVGGLLGAAAFSLGAVLFASAWTGYLAFLCAFTAICFLFTDKATGRSLLPLAVPLWILWQPPYGTGHTADVILTGRMQRLSTRMVSSTLDMLHIPHVNLGTIIEVPGLEMGVEEACSGVQSLFLYLAAAAMIGVYLRRPWWQLGLLILSAFGWALLTNTLRIVAIGVAHRWFGTDLTHGLLHDLLGYALMMVGLGLLVSCDLLLEVASGDWRAARVKSRGASGESPAGVGQELEAAFGRSGASRSGAPKRSLGSEEERRSDAPEQSLRSEEEGSEKAGGWRVLLSGMGGWQRVVVAVGVLVFGATCLLQLLDIGKLLADDRKRVDFFAGDPIMAATRDWLPESIQGWQLVSYEQVRRERGADLGQRSDSWYYQRGSRRVMISFDQAYPGWHELSRCYENSGWQTEQQQPIALEQLGSDASEQAQLAKVGSYGDRPEVERFALRLREQRGEVVFMLIDSQGTLLQPPGTSRWAAIWQRVLNRLSPRFRSRLIHGAAYQLQVVETTSGNPEIDFSESRELLADAYLHLRDRLKE